MTVLLFEVESTLWIGGIGLILEPGVPRGLAASISAGASIRLVSTQGVQVETTLVSFEAGLPDGPLPIALPRSIGKGDVAVGTKVILSDPPKGKG